MKYIYSFLKLNRQSRALLIYCLVLLSLIRLGLWRFPFAVLQKKLARLSIKRSQHHYEIGQLIWAVETSCCVMPGQVKCLARALTTQVLMQQQGYPCDLRIGVAKGTQENLEAHAWVEYQGYVIIGDLPDLVRYQPLTRQIL